MDPTDFVLAREILVMNALRFFREIHAHPLNIALHIVAGVMFGSSFVLTFYSKRVALLVSIVAVFCLLIGHLIEKSNPVFLQRFFKKKHKADRGSHLKR